MMDKSLRNTLRSVVTQCRRLLEESVGEALQGQYGIHPNASVESEDRMGHLSEEDLRCRREIAAHLEHIESQGFKPKDAVEQLVREIAFTHLNRLCAYKMMETRGLIREAVSRGIKSQGFMFYLAEHPEDETLWSGGTQDVAYRHYLRWLGGTFSSEIGALFSPHDPASRLFPPQRVLDLVLDLINSDELKNIWAEDETIGWVYQYFTPKELRDRVRKESSAPRNSYELAFRNQFYTPRYVVQFLTDNTLGRTWYEMRRGDTRLVDQCGYMIVRKNPVFLMPGETPSAGENGIETEYIRHRAKKDPRDIKILDPACGSGHFLLYCFDVLQTIYEEAYNDPDLGPALQRDYVSLADLRAEIPKLIIAHNLHGIDIDLRATQIAALALWLRAQRAYQDMDFKAEDRPKISRSNIVCAEPMPGEEDLLNEFTAKLEPDPESRLLGQLVREAFRKMGLASEAGSLLKVEQDIRADIEQAKRQWLEKPKPVQMSLFPVEKRPKPEQMTLFDVSGITDEEFWETAESRVLQALRRYAQEAVNGRTYLRQLFADDAEQGFDFIDVCRNRYDVVLMNPPFGEPSKPSKDYIQKAYPRTKNDVYAAFVERGLELLVNRGMLGAITSRTGFFLTSFQKWREEIILREAEPTVLADLGHGVLDTAMVETAAYCLAKTK